MHIKLNDMKIFGLFLVFYLVFSSFSPVFSQIQLLDKITGKTAENDSSSTRNEISIQNVNKEIEFTDNLILKRNISDFADKKQLELIQKIDTFNVYISKQGREFRKFDPAKLSHYFLVNSRVNWQEYAYKLRSYQSDLQKIIREIQEQQNHYVVNRDKWNNSLPPLERKLSPQVISHIKSNLEREDQVIQRYDMRIRDLVTSENKIMQDVIYIDGILNDINLLIDKRRAELFKQNEKNIFAAKYKNSYTGDVLSRLKYAFVENTKSFGFFISGLKKNMLGYLFFFGGLISYFLYIRYKYKSLETVDNYPNYKRINRVIIQKTWLSIFTVILILWNNITPYSPLFISLFVYLTAIILLLIILSPLVDPFIRNIIKTAIVLAILSNFEIFAWYFGGYSRFYLLAESIIGIVLTFTFIFPTLGVQKFRDQNKRMLFYTRIVAFIIFGLYSIAFLSNLAGYVNLTVFCLKLGIYAGVTSILVYGLYRITITLIDASIEVLNIYFPDVVNRFGEDIEKRLNRIVTVVLILFWAVGILRISEVFELVSSRVVTFFTHKLEVGSLSFNLGKLLFFVLVLYGTYVTATFIKRILEREILAKLDMKRGVAASISLTLRIFIVFFGTLIALSVSGLDLGKISIIAGALSVGIGFGLQNIVNNFISGLIIVYEKPVMEGDTVEVDNLLGRVTNIGIRSSTLITYDGAEVVVPNSNLISNQLINWTLSDNKKRIEIKVGTAYGADPGKVIGLLLKAALEHDKVLKEPEPRPFFTDFGDSSLNFRLLFWVRFEDGLQTQSDVAINIYNLFKENNIEIPFPQIDLHIKRGSES